MGNEAALLRGHKGLPLVKGSAALSEERSNDTFRNDIGIVVKILVRNSLAVEFVESPRLSTNKTAELSTAKCKALPDRWHLSIATVAAISSFRKIEVVMNSSENDQESCLAVRSNSSNDIKASLLSEASDMTLTVISASNASSRCTFQEISAAILSRLVQRAVICSVRCQSHDPAP